MKFRQFLEIVEMRTKIVSVSTYLLATLYVVARTGRVDPLRGVLMLTATLLVDMGTTAFNTFFDYWRGVDHPLFNRESSKVVIHEGVPGAYALLIAAGLFAAAAVLGILLAIAAGWPVLVVGAICMAVGFLYTGGPYPISRTPLGELFAGGFMGTVLFLLVWYVQAGRPDAGALLVSLPSTLMIAAILTVNNTCDIEGDKVSGRRTLSILLGRKGGEILGISLVSAGWVLIAVLGVFGALPRWAGIAVLPFAGLGYREFVTMHRRGYSHHTKGPSMGGISRVFLLFTAVLGLILSAAAVFAR